MKITWYGTATVSIDDGETRLLFDPFVRMNKRIDTTPIEGFAGFDAVLVTHGHLQVNGQKVDIPSFSCKPGDVVEVREKTSSRQLAQRSLDESQLRTQPAWLERVEGAFKGSISRLPIRDEMDKSINEQLIVEFYSR